MKRYADILDFFDGLQPETRLSSLPRSGDETAMASELAYKKAVQSQLDCLLGYHDILCYPPVQDFFQMTQEYIGQGYASLPRPDDITADLRSPMSPTSPVEASALPSTWPREAAGNGPVSLLWEMPETSSAGYPGSDNLGWSRIAADNADSTRLGMGWGAVNLGQAAGFSPGETSTQLCWEATEQSSQSFLLPMKQAPAAAESPSHARLQQQPVEIRANPQGPPPRAVCPQPVPSGRRSLPGRQEAVQVERTARETMRQEQSPTVRTGRSREPDRAVIRSGSPLPSTRSRDGSTMRSRDGSPMPRTSQRRESSPMPSNRRGQSPMKDARTVTVIPKAGMNSSGQGSAQLASSISFNSRSSSSGGGGVRPWCVICMAKPEEVAVDPWLHMI